MSAIAARIFLRWLSGFLVAKGLFAADDASIFSDPELEQFVMLAIGTGAGAVAEGWHWLARKYGWSL